MGGTTLGLRRADLLVELGPGDRHRHVLGVAVSVEDVLAHRLVGAVVALRSRSGRGPVRAPPVGQFPGQAAKVARARSPDGPIQSAAHTERAQALGPEAAGALARPIGLRQSPAGERRVTERPRPSVPVSGPPRRRGCCRRRGDARCRGRRAARRRRAGQRRGESARPPAGAAARCRSPACRARSPRGAGTAADHRVPDVGRRPEPVDQQQGSRSPSSGAPGPRGPPPAARAARPEPRFREEDLDVADAALQETRLGAAQVEVPEAA